MKSIFLTGISGNVGSAVFEYLKSKKAKIVAGVRNINKYENQREDIRFVHFDFEDPSTFSQALRGVEKVFMMRPPQITNVDGVFRPFIETCIQHDVKHIVFLSLLGVEKNPFPPHHKIEKIILQSGIDYTFIRPSFFMQNLSTTHVQDIKDRNDLFIPSGKAKISFIDTRDIGEIIGRTLIEKGHRNQKYTLTGPEAIDYEYVAKVMSEVLGRRITYSNPGLLKFRKDMIQRGIKKEFANVMMLLYLTTKLGMANHLTKTAENILGRKPYNIYDFVMEYQDVWKQEG